MVADHGDHADDDGDHVIGDDGDHVVDVVEPDMVGDDGDGDVGDDGDHMGDDGDHLGDDFGHVRDVVEPDVVGQWPPIDEHPAQLVHPTLTCNWDTISETIWKCPHVDRRMKDIVGRCFQKRKQLGLT